MQLPAGWHYFPQPFEVMQTNFKSQFVGQSGQMLDDLGRSGDGLADHVGVFQRSFRQNLLSNSKLQ